MSKTYLVTGGCGFIGSYVIEELLKDKDADIRVKCIDKMGVGSNINHLPLKDYSIWCEIYHNLGLKII